MRYVIASPTYSCKGLYEKYGFHHFLIAYGDETNWNRFPPCLKEGDTLIVDSGAFSAWNINKVINIDEYKEFCLDIYRKIGDKVEMNFVNLDVIPGKPGKKPTAQEIEDSAKKSYENYHYLKKATGLNFIPVFHQHESFERLQKYIDEDVEYLGISPANDLKPKDRLKRLYVCYYKYLIPSGKKIKTHGFGVTTYSIIKQIPFFSCDSTSWKSSWRYNSFFQFTNGQLKTYSASTIRTKLGIDLGKLSTAGKQEYNIRALAKMRNYLEQLWKVKGEYWK